MSCFQVWHELREYDSAIADYTAALRHQPIRMNSEHKDDDRDGYSNDGNDKIILYRYALQFIHIHTYA